MPAPWLRLAVALFAVSWGANQFAPMQLVYSRHLGLTSGSFTAMLGAYVLGLVPALLYFGRVADRAGRRVVIRSMIPVSVVSSLVLLLGPLSPELLYVGRVLAGVASGMAFGAGTAWMKELSARAPVGAGARRAAVSLSAGFGCGALFAGVVAQWLPAPQVSPYVVHIALMIAALALVWPVPETRTVRTAPAATRVTALSKAPFLRGVVPWTPWVFGTATIAFATLPPRVEQSLGAVSIAFTGTIAALTMITGAVIQPWARRFLDHREEWGAPAGAVLGVLGLGAAGVVVHTDGAVAVVAVFGAALLLGSCYGVLLISGLVAVERLAPEDELAQSVAVYYCLIYLGFALPFLVSVLAPRIGYGTCFAAIAVLMIASVLVARTAPAPRARPARRDDVSPVGR
ncbi:MFS transporter [Prescottella equi]|uniref:MFS transporter n=1 Tax=Rhodococcus hoagii TaxID=43767 RepID=UPI001EE9E283|nr:MFS transporter [Prescottella equi]